MIRGVHNKPRPSLEVAATASSRCPSRVGQTHKCMAKASKVWSHCDKCSVIDCFDERTCRIFTSTQNALSHYFVNDSSFSEAKIGRKSSAAHMPRDRSASTAQKATHKIRGRQESVEFVSTLARIPCKVSFVHEMEKWTRRCFASEYVPSAWCRFSLLFLILFVAWLGEVCRSWKESGPRRALRPVQK